MRLSILATAVLAIASLAPAARAQSRQQLTPTKPEEASTSFTPGIVADGSFEGGTTGTAWTQASTAFGTPICSAAACGTGGGSAAPRTGTFYVWFGGATAGDVASMQQTVTIPTAPSTSLKFYLKIPVVAGGTGFVAAKMDGVEVFRATYAADQATYTNYTLVTVPVGAYANGAAHVLRIESTTTGSGNFYVDDVSIEAGVTGPQLSANPAALSFGTAQAVGTTSAPQTVTLTNGGTTATTVTGITSSNAAFAVTAPTLPVTLAAGATATFTVRFTPANTTAQTGNILVASNAPGSPLAIAVTGTGNADVTTAVPPGTTVGSPGYNRSTNLGTGASGSCTLSTTAVSVPYKTRPFTVPAAGGGSYTITTDFSGTPNYDGFIFVYRTSFVPTDPCLNLIAFDDDFLLPPNTSELAAAQIAALALTPGSYVLVVTGFGNGNAGAFTGTVVGPAAVTFPIVAGEGTAQNAFASLSATPNPVRGAARVSFTTATAADVTVAVYDVTGRQVATLFQGVVTAGQTVTTSLDAAGLPSGVYVVRAVGADVNLTQRVTVVR